MAAPSRRLSFRLTLNPLTKAYIKLPPVPTSPNNRKLRTLATRVHSFGDDTPFPTSLRFYQFMSDAGEHIVAVKICEEFLYCRVQDTAWTSPAHPSQTYINSVAYHRGRFYVAYENGKMATCELIPGAQITLLPSLKLPVNSNCFNLVHVADELIMVACPSFIGKEAEDCHFYKLDMDGQLKWSKIQDIGNYTLFLTVFNNIFAINTAEVSGYKRNCMYISSGDVKSFTNQRFYVVSVEDGIVDTIPIFEEERTIPQISSSWFMPTLC